MKGRCNRAANALNTRGNWPRSLLFRVRADVNDLANEVKPQARCERGATENEAAITALTRPGHDGRQDPGEGTNASKQTANGRKHVRVPPDAGRFTEHPARGKCRLQRRRRGGRNAGLRFGLRSF